MGADVIQIRDYPPKPSSVPRGDDPALVIILPVVRIERNPDDLEVAKEIGRRLRRRLPRSLLSLKRKMELLRILQAAERSRE